MVQWGPLLHLSDHFLNSYFIFVFALLTDVWDNTCCVMICSSSSLLVDGIEPLVQGLARLAQLFFPEVILSQCRLCCVLVQWLHVRRFNWNIVLCVHIGNKIIIITIIIRKPSPNDVSNDVIIRIFSHAVGSSQKLPNSRCHRALPDNYFTGRGVLRTCQMY